MGNNCRMDKLLKHLNSLNKADRSAFVAACETSEGYLRKAISTGQKIGERLCIAIDRESQGAVRCEDLRTDVDWEYLRGNAGPVVAASKEQEPAHG